MTYTSEPVGAGRLKSIQNRGHFAGQFQVGMTDNRSRCPGWTVDAASAGCSLTLDELNLTHWTQFFGAVRTVHRPGFDKHRGPNVMAAVNVGVQFVDQIPLIWCAGQTKIPKMVMGVADWNIRF
jgi:hypothetical protein